jgi:hypothetical protein
LTAGRDRKTAVGVPVFYLSCLPFVRFFAKISAALRAFSAFPVFFQKRPVPAEKRQNRLKFAALF